MNRSFSVAGPETRGSGREILGRWIHVEREAPELDPFTFLADSAPRDAAPAGGEPGEAVQSRAGGPRVYWRTEQDWIAGRGALARIDSREFEDEDACRAVRIAASELLGPPAGAPSGPATSDSAPDHAPRMYGGFAFHSRWSRQGAVSAASPWTEFPAARFFLPAYELEGRAGRVTLRAWHRVGASEDLESVQTAARRDLDHLHARLRGQKPEMAAAARAAPAGVSGSSVAEVVTWPEWQASVARVLERIRTGEMQKVVLSRAVDVRLEQPPDPVRLVEKLVCDNPNANVFLFQPTEGVALVGSSPELLGSLRGRDFRTMAVAGSAPRGDDRETDERLGRALQESPKDRLEHAICVRELEDRLGRVTTRLDVQDTPRLHRLAEIQHLRTDLAAEVEEETHVLDLVAILHPTAAVCGRPREIAAAVLEAEEPVPRGWYAGAVGWFDAAGDGDFVPGLRCAVLDGEVMRLFAGAGIVEQSHAKTEWKETSLKLRTVGRALGLEEFG